MLLKPTVHDWRIIAHYSGRLLLGIGLVMAIPLITAVVFGEWDSALDFTIGAAIAIGIGLFLTAIFPETADLTTVQGLAVVALAWVLAMLVGAVPMFLSGHFNSYLDASFDSMSGFATTGLVLIQDLDHVGNALNMWRHLIMFIGGQGIAVVALSLLVRVSGSGGAFEIYAGEAREERIVPNVIRTTKFIWVISLTYLVIGAIVLTSTFVAEGLGPVKGFLHSLWIFMAAWDTGGFAPQSQNILFYHSGWVETFTMFFMIGGTLSFGLHYAVWRGMRSELWRNIEPITLFATMTFLTLGALLGLAAVATYGGYDELYRKGVYHMISAHTGTGYQTVYSRQFPLEWGALPLLAIMIAMGLGGSASSTAGGIKALRIGVIANAFVLEVKRLISPEAAIIVQRYHHFKERLLNERIIRNSLLIFSAYLLTYFVGASIGMLFGYPFIDALFESTSAAGNVGLSAGVTTASMPDLLKIVYILQMWAGRLEFLGVWALVGLVIAMWRGK